MMREIEVKRSWVEYFKGRHGEDKIRYRLLYYDALTHKLRKKSITLLKDTPQARRKAHNKILDEIQASYDQFDTHSLSLELLKEKYFEYLDTGKSGLHYQTAYLYETQINRFLLSVDSDIVADEIKITFLNKYFDNLFAEGKSYSYINVRKAALNSMFGFGVNYGYCHNNPLVGYKLKHKQVKQLQRTENKYFTANELRKILLYFENGRREDIADILKFTYLTGLRMSEATSLYVKDIFEADGNYYCQVNGTQILVHNGGKPPTTENDPNIKKKVAQRLSHVARKQDITKTNNGMRYIKLDPLAVEIYQRHKTNHKYLFLTKNEPIPGLTRYTRGKPFQRSAINAALQRAAKKNKITKKVTTHFLRHTFVSKAASFDVSFDYNFISQLGHKDATITHEIYDHINAINHEQLKEDYKKLDEDIAYHII